MNTLRILLSLLLITATARAAPRQEWFRNLSLENAVGSSDLILAAQVTEITEIKLMRGGKGESSMYQYKFKPSRVLKGVFARDELSMGSADLGLYRLEEMKTIKQGAFMLIFLGRSDVGFHNSNRKDNGMSAQSMPPLRDAQDPLLDAVKTLLAVRAERDRSQCVALLVDGLNKSSGPGAVTLLKSLQIRGLPAAQNADVAGAVTRHLTDASPAVREAAAQALTVIQERDYLEHAALREAAVGRSVEALQLADPNAMARAAIMRVIGAAGDAASKNPAAMAQLTAGPATDGTLTTVDRAAQFRALGTLKTDAPGAGVEAALLQVPLDDDGEYTSASEFALARIQPAKAAAILQARVGKKIAAGLSSRIEIESFAHLPADNAIPTLLEISRLALEPDEKSALAETCRKLVEEKPDPRLVGLLTGLLSPGEPSRDAAISALLKIDSDAAAKALQPHVRQEEDLHRKLRIAEMLGRHGLRDGYAFAIEHASEQSYLEAAVAALAAIKEPEAAGRLKEILESSNDVRWNTAAVRGLGVMNAQEMRPKFLALIEDLRNPLAPAALIALGDLGESKALDKVGEGLGSRNDVIVSASARAAGKLLAHPGIAAAGIRDKLIALLSDPEADAGSRTAALESLVALKDDNLDKALAKIVRESALENSELLDRVEKLLRERKVKL